MLRFRFTASPGLQYSYSLQRVADGACLDFADGAFRAAPAVPTKAIAEGASPFSGRYAESYSPPAGQPSFWNGVSILTIHLTGPATDPAGAPSTRALAEFPVEFQNGGNTQVYPMGPIGPASPLDSFFTF